jgi:hypothetical protein
MHFEPNDSTGPMVRRIFLLATDILVSEVTQPPTVLRFYPVLFSLSKAVFIAQTPQPRR